MNTKLLVVLLVLISLILTSCIDIKPGSANNPLNVNAKGVLSVAIPSWPEFSGEFDGLDPDDLSNYALGIDELRVPAIPDKILYEDVTGYTVSGTFPNVSTSVTGTPDGEVDVVVYFDIPELASGLQLNTIADGEEVALTLYYGEAALGTDIVTIMHKGK